VEVGVLLDGVGSELDVGREPGGLLMGLRL
jgi:hypothetical protein